VGISDLIGIYGAILASSLAVIQYRQWRHSQERFAIDVYDESSAPPNHVEITITNLSNSKALLKFVGIGIGCRTWLRPWKLSHVEIIGMKACEDGYLTKKGVEDDLDAGQSIQAYADAELFSHISKLGLSLRKGFGWKWIIEIDHSLPPYSSRRIMKWSLNKRSFLVSRK
jgi:hypothetical protein